MIKPDSAYMQSIRHDEEVDVSAERRAELAYKGERLYFKYCGTKGTGICAESFAEYHIWRGEYVVARDLLRFLVGRADHLRARPGAQAAAQLAMTDQLIVNVENLLGESRETVQNLASISHPL